jgi:hypothetical protein
VFPQCFSGEAFGARAGHAKDQGLLKSIDSLQIGIGLAQQPSDESASFLLLNWLHRSGALRSQIFVKKLPAPQYAVVSSLMRTRQPLAFPAQLCTHAANSRIWFVDIGKHHPLLHYIYFEMIVRTTRVELGAFLEDICGSLHGA